MRSFQAKQGLTERVTLEPKQGESAVSQAEAQLRRALVCARNRSEGGMERGKWRASRFRAAESSSRAGFLASASIWLMEPNLGTVTRITDF